MLRWHCSGARDRLTRAAPWVRKRRAPPVSAITSSLSTLVRRLRGRGRPRRVVYTCLFGFSEHFNDFAYQRDDIDFVCFTDDPELRSEFWTMRLVRRSDLDPARMAKRIKALPHRFLPEYDWSLYVDNTVRLKVPPAQLFDEFLAPSASPLVCFRHHERDCVYQEAEEVIALAYDDPERVREQMKVYRDLGYPAHNGLAKSAFLLRRHRDPELAPVLERWHEQVLRHSKRDQLSFNPVTWFERFEVGYLKLAFEQFQLLEWPVLKGGVRVPRDFDDARYLALNPDVNFDARRHWLYYGARERRRYK
jgi:hypothetical protein